MVRIKHRYLLLNILYPDTPEPKSSSSTPGYLQFYKPIPQHVNQQLLLSHLRSHITLLFGDHGLGVSQSSLKIVYFSHATSTAILRVPRAHFRLTWAALTFMNELPPAKGSSSASGLKCVIRVVRTSGTIRKAEEELVRRSRHELLRAKLDGQYSANSVLDKIAGSTSNPKVIPTDVDAGLTKVVNDDEDYGESESE